jgi:acyl dehydratase
VRAAAHERFSAAVVLTPDDASAYAAAVGDNNPVHHDEAFAATTRFGRPIASTRPPWVLGLIASHFSKRCAIVGLEFWVRFKKAIFADERIVLEWLVVKVTPNAKLGGDVVELRGRIRNSAGETALGAKGRDLVTDQL